MIVPASRRERVYAEVASEAKLEEAEVLVPGGRVPKLDGSWMNFRGASLRICGSCNRHSSVPSIPALSRPNSPQLAPLTSQDLKLVPSFVAAVQPTGHRRLQLLPAPGHSPEDAGCKKLAEEDTDQEEENGSG